MAGRSVSRAEVFTSEAMRWLDDAAPDDALPDETANKLLQPEFVDGEAALREARLYPRT